VPDDLTQAVAAELRRLVKERGLSGRKLAELSGIPTNNVAAKLRADRPIDMADLERLAAALGVTGAHVVARAEAELAHPSE
jgi:transcriptional regulator with XRE-family HTH domain